MACSWPGQTCRWRWIGRSRIGMIGAVTIFSCFCHRSYDCNVGFRGSKAGQSTCMNLRMRRAARLLPSAVTSLVTDPLKLRPCKSLTGFPQGVNSPPTIPGLAEGNSRRSFQYAREHTLPKPRYMSTTTTTDTPPVTVGRTRGARTRCARVQAYFYNHRRPPGDSTHFLRESGKRTPDAYRPHQMGKRP